METWGAWPTSTVATTKKTGAMHAAARKDIGTAPGKQNVAAVGQAKVCKGPGSNLRVRTQRLFDSRQPVSRPGRHLGTRA